MKSMLAVVGWLLLAVSLQAQTKHTLVLEVPVASPQGYCGNITSETIDGQPFTLNGGGYSIVLSPNGTQCSDFDRGIGVILPPQPFLSYNGWFNPAIPGTNVTRGPFVLESGSTYTTTDTFHFTDPNLGTWTGKMVGTWTETIYRGHPKYTPNSYQVTMTGTTPN
jgi:hypothetical protein